MTEHQPGQTGSDDAPAYGACGGSAERTVEQPPNPILCIHDQSADRVHLQMGGMSEENYQRLDAGTLRRIEAIRIERDLEHSGLVAGAVGTHDVSLQAALEWVRRFNGAYEQGKAQDFVHEYVQILLSVREAVSALHIVIDPKEAPHWNTIGKLDRDWDFCPELFLAMKQSQAHVLTIVPEHHRLRVQGALEESLPNHLRHGNACDPRKIVVVDARRESNILHVHSHDEGRGFRHGTVDDPTEGNNLERPYGRGLLLMNAYMDEVHFAMGGRKCLMSKKLA